MSFPLIPQPAPLQQLAETISGIRQRRQAEVQARDERNLAATDSKRRDAYFALNAQEAADRRASEARLAAHQLAETELAKAQFAATLHQQEIENAGRQFAQRQQLISAIARNLPPGFTADYSRLNAEASYQMGNMPLPATLEQDITAARTGARPGVQGSVVRPAVSGSAHGVTYTPETLNANYPSGAVGGRYDDRARLQLAGTESLVQATQDLENRERANPVNAQRPWGSVFSRMAAGAMRKIGAEDSADAFENVGLSGGQTEYKGVAEQWTHNYIPNLPNFRMSVPMFRSVQRAFFPPAGETNPEVVASFTRRRRAVVEGLVQARQRGVSETDLAQMVAQNLRAFGATGAATALERAARVGGTAGPMTALPDATTTPPQIDPRFIP